MTWLKKIAAIASYITVAERFMVVANGKTNV